jgi:UPF0755 protein
VTKRSRAKRSRAKRSRWFAGFGVLTLLVAGAIGGVWVLDYPDRAQRGAGEDLEVTIAPGTSFIRISELLNERGVIEHPHVFRIYAARRGAATQVRSGTYALRDDMSPREVLDVLVRGVPDPHVSVTIPEGFHLLEIFDVLEAHGVAERAELERLAFDPAFLEARDLEGPSAEGYLFPDTYQFRVPTPADVVLDRMIARHNTVWNQLRETHAASYERLAGELGWRERDFIIMASIVEKEAVAADERPRIAQVFINRLLSPQFRPRLLQTDPTIRYGCMVPLEGLPAGCEGWTTGDRLRRKQLDDRDNPYNTYQHEGLPPGPIASPGRASLEATLAPDGSDYFYFVSRNDGTHVFSRSLRDHNRAVDRYQRRARAP